MEREGESLPPEYVKSLFAIYEKRGDDLFKTGMHQAFESLTLKP